MGHLPPPTVLTYRHLLTSSVEEFLAEQRMTCPGTAEALSDLAADLAHYREEGVPLFPAVFFCDDLPALMTHVGGCDVLHLGAGPRAAETTRRALKQCGPLGSGGWSMFVERRGGLFQYGVFRTDGFVLCETAMEILRATRDHALSAVGVVQLAENVLELRGSTGSARYLYLSGARPDVLPLPLVLGDFLDALTRDVAPEVLTDVRRFYRRVLIDALRASHGALAVVIEGDALAGSLFADAIFLDPPVDVPGRVAAYRETKSTASRAAVHGAGHLLGGMLRSDGITVLRTDGTIVGYNAFVRLPPTPREAARAILGGARRRTFEVLSGEVGRGIVAAFFRSQDGDAQCLRAT